MAEIPSARPTKPNPSEVVALTDIWSTSTPMTRARFSFIAGKENWELYRCDKYESLNDDMMIKWYSIFYVNELKPYIISQSTETGRTYYTDYGYNGHNIKEL